MTHKRLTGSVECCGEDLMVIMGRNGHIWVQPHAPEVAVVCALTGRCIRDKTRLLLSGTSSTTLALRLGLMFSPAIRGIGDLLLAQRKDWTRPAKRRALRSKCLRNTPGGGSRWFVE